MDNDTLPEYLDLIKQHLTSQAQLTQHLLKAETMLELILGQDLFTYPKSQLRDSLLTISQSVQKARALSEELMPSNNKITPLLLPLKPHPD